MSPEINVVREIRQSHLMKYHRGKSWEHCYFFFKNYKKIRKDESFLDFAALHLGFFLASWGMLRGSSFLLKKDYKFYIPIIKILINLEYDVLWNIDFLNESGEQGIDKLFQLKAALEAEIVRNNMIDEDNKKHELNLIVTKIIMATMGCIPAYDRYFKEGFKEKFNRNINFNEVLSFKSLLESINNDDELKKIYKQSCPIQGTDISYPPMKLIDLYFWLLGFNKQNEANKTLRNKNYKNI